jgi:hypothetical protein
MKTSKFILSFFLFICSLVSYAQPPDWNTAGNTVSGGVWFGANTSSDEPVSFEHQADDDASSFIWSTTTSTTLLPRMILTRPGWLGLNTASPAMLFHVNNGGILSTGTAGANPNLGAGTRLMWIPEKRALRGGLATGSEWNGSEVGNCSIAFGENVTAQGNHSVSLGKENFSIGNTSITIGLQNEAIETNSLAIGCYNFVDVNASFAFGSNNYLEGTVQNFAFGNANQIWGAKAFCFGSENFASAPCSFTYGQNLFSNAHHAMVIGYGLNSGNSLLNSTANSIAIGVNSTVPTIFITDSGGTGQWGNVGFGNITAPTELIDVNGNARFRDMPSGAGNVLVTGVEEDAAGDYSLSTLEFSADGDEYLGGDGAWHAMPVVTCDWDIVGTGNNLAMGYSGACVPKNVGIGTSSPDSKLSVLNTLESSGQTVYVRSGASGSIVHDGLNLSASGGTLGVRGISSEASASANTSSSNVLLIGVRGRATSQPSGTDYTGYAGVYGIYGSTGGAVSGTDYYAGYFAGDVYSTGAYLPSDEALKTNIQPAGSSLDKLAQLEVNTYNYNTDQYTGMNLPAGEQTGLIAGNVAEAFPALVKGATQPAEVDEEGNVISEAVSFNAVNYAGLVPHLVKAIQEQQAQIEALTALVNQCCASGGDKSLQGSGSTSSPTAPSDFDLRIEQPYLGQNVPNPFMYETSITYRIPEQAMVRVRILNQGGQHIDTLVDGLMPKGEYKIVWNASHLPAGLYLYTLEADGVELVKKAVKL